MSRKIKIVSIFIWCIFGKSTAQDVQFTQFYSAASQLNPAFTGLGVCSRVTLNHRIQWPGVSEGFTSSIVSYDHYLRESNIGIGLIVERDVAGSSNLTRTLINPILSYQVRLSRKIGISFGVQPGVGFGSLDFSNLIFADQITRGGNVATVEEFPQNVFYFDIGSGILLYSKNVWLGGSFYHLNSPNESVTNNSDGVIPIRSSIHGGYKIKLKEDNSITTAFNYRAQAKFDQVDIGAYYTKSILNIGLWYRGIPFFKSFADGFSNNDAIAVILGLKTERFSIGYSYDFTISRLNNSSSNGAHEISLTYQFCNVKRKRRKRRLFIECPSF